LKASLRLCRKSRELSGQPLGKIPLVRIVCEASGGTKAEPRIRCQLIYGVSGAVDYVEYMGAREELATHPRIIGINLAELATQKTGLT
jgi:hypothetical protein